MPKQVITIVGGGPDLARRARELVKAVDDELPMALMSGGMLLTNAWKRNIVAMGAVDTGTYLRSVHPEITARREGFAEVTVGTDITDPPYPDWVEHGTSQMEPRPAARNAYDENQDTIQNEVIGTLRELFARRYGGF